MKKVVLSLIGILVSSLTYAKPEQKLLLLGEGQIKNFSVNFGDGYCENASGSEVGDATVIDGGFQCKDGRSCYVYPKYWIELN